MYGLFKARRGRRAATAAIAPFVDGSRRRMGGIPDSAWRDPYFIGFLGRLITLVSNREVGALKPDYLAAVQAGTWRDVTGTPGDLIGEDICFLSACGDGRFVEGCRQAEAFLEALDAASSWNDPGLDGAGEIRTRPVWVDGGDGSVLWSRCFDARLG
jgi:hypothetical protein